ncbi:unnamed protein product, partial [Amoebophrya sp. A25]
DLGCHNADDERNGPTAANSKIEVTTQSKINMTAHAPLASVPQPQKEGLLFLFSDDRKASGAGTKSIKPITHVESSDKQASAFASLASSSSQNKSTSGGKNKSLYQSARKSSTSSHK